MIHITISDPTIEIFLPTAPELTVTSPVDYVRAYSSIANAAHTGRDLRVLVKDKIVGKWLKVMADRYGPVDIVVEEFTPRKLFQSQTGISTLPDEITDERLLDSKLLEVKIPAAPGISFEDYLLEVFFGSFLILPNGLRRVGEIVSNYEPEQWQGALKRPLVREVFQNRVQALRQELDASGRQAEKQLLDWIDTSPQVFIRNLFAIKVLTGYPEEIGKRVFGAIFTGLIKLNLDLRKVPVVVAGNEKTLNEVSVFLEQSLAVSNQRTLDDLLRRVSGLLETEFDAVQRLISSGKYPVTNDLVSAVQAKFRTLESSPRIAQALADLDLQITKSPPSSPNETWGPEEWLKWATQEYLPYRYWLENTNQLNDEIGEIANNYADWLYRNYGQILYHSNHMVWKALLNLREDMKSSPGPILVAVIDNFNTKFYPDLRLQMQFHGFYEHQMDYCFSLLPSCTEVSKKGLMTGHYAPFPETSYQDQVEDTWSAKLGRKVKYLATLTDLRAVNSRQHDVYFLNYLPLDITLHLNEDQIGISHAQTIRSHLNLLSQDIRSFAQRIGAERDMTVIIISDHGSTRIPKGTVNVIGGDFYRNRAEDEHQRYVAISDDELRKLPENAKFDCYVFEKSIYALTSNYLVARRLYRFLPTSDHAYIHGGLTPEETLVPLAIYRPAAISPKPLTVTLVGNPKIYVGAKIDLRLEITNVNNYPCEHVRIEFIDSNLEAEDRVIPVLAQLNRTIVEMPARCPRSAKATTRKLAARLSFDFLGQPWEYQVDIPAEIVDPAKTKFDLDNL